MAHDLAQGRRGEVFASPCGGDESDASILEVIVHEVENPGLIRNARWLVICVFLVNFVAL